MRLCALLFRLVPRVFLTVCLNFGLIKLGLCACIPQVFFHLVSLISASVWPAGMSVISKWGSLYACALKRTFNRRQLSFRRSVARDLAVCFGGRFLSTVTYSLMSFERSPHYSHSPSFLIFICIPCFACLFDMNLLPNLLALAMQTALRDLEKDLKLVDAKRKRPDVKHAKLDVNNA